MDAQSVEQAQHDHAVKLVEAVRQLAAPALVEMGNRFDRLAVDHADEEAEVYQAMFDLINEEITRQFVRSRD